MTAALLLSITGRARADFMQTYNLDQSNALPSGVTYATVKIQGSTSTGDVTLTFSANPAPYTSTGKNFGFHTVGFNTDLSLTAAQISVPTGWNLKAGANLSQFGRISWSASTSKDPAPTVVIDIGALSSSVTLADFTVNSSKGNAAVYFAGHIIDFGSGYCGVTSQWVGGSTGVPNPVSPPPPPSSQGGPPSATPEPSGLALGGLGLAGLGFTCWRRRRGY